MKKLHRFLITSALILGAVLLTNAQTGGAYNGPHNVDSVTPLVVEAEDFDVGDNETGGVGPNYGYADRTSSNDGNNTGYRTTEKDISTDVGVVALVSNYPDEHTYYTITVPSGEAGDYKASVTYRSGGDNKTIVMHTMESDLSGTTAEIFNAVGMNTSGVYETLEDTDGTTFNLSEGTHIIRLRANNAAPYFDKFTLTRVYVGLPFSGTAIELGQTQDVATKVEFEKFDKTSGDANGANSNDGSDQPSAAGTYYDSTGGNSNDSTVRNGSDVDIEYDSEDDFDYITSVTGGEYLLYTVEIVESGAYTVAVNYGHSGSNKNITLILRDTSTLTSVLTLMDEELLPATGGSTTFADHSVSSLSLTAGTYVLEARLEDAGPSFDYMSFTRNTTVSVESVDGIKKVIAYPNPSNNGIFTLESSQEWAVYSVSGSKVLEGESDTINLSSSPEGVYILKIGASSQRLIVQ